VLQDMLMGKTRTFLVEKTNARVHLSQPQFVRAIRTKFRQHPLIADARNNAYMDKQKFKPYEAMRDTMNSGRTMTRFPILAHGNPASGSF
jgi:hypothetical protein